VCEQTQHQSIKKAPFNAQLAFFRCRCNAYIFYLEHRPKYFSAAVSAPQLCSKAKAYSYLFCAEARHQEPGLPHAFIIIGPLPLYAIKRNRKGKTEVERERRWEGVRHFEKLSSIWP
jgi:hypothetical protein